MRSLLLLAMIGLALSPLAAQPRFEVAAWVDHFDFVGAAEKGRLLFDTETFAGNTRILDHVQELGATTILWRNCAGGAMRYQSRHESGHQDAPLDKRRVPGSVPLYGWVRYGQSQPDIVRSVLSLCRERGLRPGIHWPFEENHHAGFTVGGWNLDHPQFWCRTGDGVPWCGRASLGFPEVMAHKLDLFDELTERGAQVVFLDFFRTGGWGPPYEYTEPVKAAYRAQYGEEPPENPRDRRWCGHVSGYVTELLRQLRAHADAARPPVQIAVGIPGIAPIGDQPLLAVGADWPRWVREGLIDTLVINDVAWSPADPYGSTRARYAEVLQVTRGHCRLLCPVAAYDFTGHGIPTYMQVTGQSFAQVATRLTELAWEVGADGISLECVDYNNYPPDVRQAMRALVEGKCRQVKAP